MLISILIYQSAVFVFLDGSRVSEGLVKVMVIWLSICLSLAQLFLLCALMAATNVVNVVVHSFAADSSLLDGCDLVGFFPPYVCRLATVCVFEVVSAVLFVSFGVSCFLA